MKRKIPKLVKLRKFTKEILEYLNWNDKLDEKPMFFSDYMFEKNNEKYAVEIRGTLDLGIKKKECLIKEYNELKDHGYKNIIFVYSKVNIHDYQKFKECALVLDISNILYLIRNNVFLTNKLIGILDYSVKKIKIKKPCTNIEYNEKEVENSKDKIKILESIAPGKNSFEIYQTFCIETLKYLFSDNLDLWDKQQVTADRLNIYDLICKIKNNCGNEFFSTLENHFNSRYIIFEFKNYSKCISQREIYTTEKYLYETSLRNVAIIITRKGINNNGNKVIDGLLRSNKKIIIVLTDEDIKNMIKLKEEGDNPSIILINKLDYLFTHLEK